MAQTLMNLNTNRGYQISCLDGSLPDQKAVIICLHGFGGSKRSLKIQRLHEEMKEAQVGTFTFDWPGHGESEAAFSDLMIGNCLEDLRTVYEHVKRTYNVPIWCFATSFGGYLAMLYHQRNPGAFEKIVLRSPALRMGKIMLTFMDDDQIRRFFQGDKLDFGMDQPLILARDFYDDVCRYDAYFKRPSHPERIFIIQGDQDEVVPPEHTIEFARRYGIRIYLLKGADHAYSHPGDVDELMAQAKAFYLMNEGSLTGLE